MTPYHPEYHSRRSPVYARNGMVATTQPLATQAGLQILARGGNAADAAVSVAAALNVTEPCSTGLGGDCFALYYDRASGAISALNGSGRAPAGLSLDLLNRQGIRGAIPSGSGHEITVPGACAGWVDLSEAHGRLSLMEVLAPAIRLAEEGFPVAPIAAEYWSRNVETQLKRSPGGAELLISGRAPRPGEVFRNPTLANTLRAIAEDGKETFYRGEIAGAIVRVVSEFGGVMSLDDLARHESTWDVPISTLYGGVRVWECPPNGQGLAALLALNILSCFDIPADPLAVERLHLLIEALRLAFADTRWYVADPAFNDIPLEELLSIEYARSRAKLIDPHRATLDTQRGSPVPGSDTVYFSVVDGEGNACSFINSNYRAFGSGIVAPGTGFSLQNRGQGFSLEVGHPNALAPGKRPYHTIIPALATREGDGSLYASFGVMGAYMQPQGHVQVLLSLVNDRVDPQTALDQPRICLPDGRAGSSVMLEEGIPLAVMSQLAEMGHSVRPVSGIMRWSFGKGQIITRNAHNGVLCGGSDPRADGMAAGL